MADNTITIEHVIKGSDNNHGNIDISQLLRQQHFLLETLQSVATKFEKTIKPRTERKTSEEKQAEEIAKAKVKIAETTAKQNDKNMLAHMKSQEKQNAKEEKNEEKLSQLKLKNQLKSYDLEQKNITDTKKIIESQAKREKQATEDFYKARNKNLSNAKAQEYANWWQNTLNEKDDKTNFYKTRNSNISNINNQEYVNWWEETLDKKDQKKDLQNKAIGGIAGMLGASLVSYIGRELDISARYTMAKAQNTGSFAQSTVMGRGMQDYPSYLASQVQAKKQEQIAQHSSSWAIMGDIIKSSGTLLGGLAGAPLALATGGLSILGGAGAGYAMSSQIADSLSNYFAAPGNAKISQQYDVKSAYAQRDAIMSINQWQTSLSRFGGKGEDLAGFQARYGKDQNALGIQTGIAPYLNHAFNKDNLKDVAQGFLKAGFSVNDFARLTMQSAQAMAVSGKGIMEFSKDVIHAQGIYGKGYDLGTNQTALDLQSKYGMNRDISQNLAYQSMFNPNLMSNVDKYYSNTRASWEQKKALGESLGFNFNKTEQTGHLSGATPAFKKELAKELHDIDTGKAYGDLLTKLGVGNVGITQARSWLQPEAETLKNGSKRGEDISKNEAQSVGGQILQAIQGGFSKVDNMSVTVTGNMTIVNNGGMSTGSGYMPSMFGVPGYNNTNIPVGKQ